MTIIFDVISILVGLVAIPFTAVLAVVLFDRRSALLSVVLFAAGMLAFSIGFA